VIRLHLPADLARDLSIPATLTLAAAPDLAGVLANLEEACPGVRSRLAEADGELRPHLTAFAADRNSRTCGGVAMAIEDGDEVWVLRAVSGG
jgi:molybdopterin synthase sulfur carrier subunit